MDVPIDWLLEGEPFIQYRVRRDLLCEEASAPAVQQARQGMLSDGRVLALVRELADWPGTVLASHKSASQSFHKLGFMVELGITLQDPGVEPIVSAILSHQSEEGPFQLPMNIPTHYGGTGRETWAWALCDAPLVIHGLARLGLAEDPRVHRAAVHLHGLARELGWPCVVSRQLGSFRGPGRKGDPCPFATLAMLKALIPFQDFRNSTACRAGAESLLGLWQESLSRHPYMFFMGNDFRKLKAPCVWYDILHVLDVLSHFPWLGEDARLLELVTVVRQKADEQGRFTAESVWTPWKEWEFGQKKRPSRWITLLAWRAIGRIEGSIPRFSA